jgi:hypothetical protein
LSGVTVLTPEQTAENERIFGVRYRSIDARPEIPSRKERRRRGQRLRSHGQGTMAVSRKHLAEQSAIYDALKNLEKNSNSAQVNA